jgi:hypothetical protein
MYAIPYDGIMKEKELRVRISSDLYKRYKMLCLEMDLSLPKQTSKLIENFIQIQTDNLRIQKQLKKMGKE